MVYESPKHRSQPEDSNHRESGWGHSHDWAEPLYPATVDHYAPTRLHQESQKPAAPPYKQLNIFEANGIDFGQFETPGKQSQSQSQSESQEWSPGWTEPAPQPQFGEQLNWFEYNNFEFNNIDPALLPKRPQVQYSPQEIAQLLQLPLKPQPPGEKRSLRYRSRGSGPLTMDDLRRELPRRQLSVDGNATDPEAGWMSWEEQKQREQDGTLASGQKYSGLRAIVEYMEAHPEDQPKRGLNLDKWLAKAEAYKAQQAQAKADGVQVATTELSPGMLETTQGKQSENQPLDVPQPPDQLAQNSSFIHLPPDIQQQVLTRQPMNSAAELEAATIQQIYGFENAAFARWVVQARLQESAIRSAWVKEALRPGGAPQNLPAGYDVGHFESSTPLTEPHQNGQGRFYYDVTLSGQADAYYRHILPEAKRIWVAEMARRQQLQAQVDQQQAQQQVQSVPQAPQAPQAPQTISPVPPAQDKATVPPIAFDNQFVVPLAEPPQTSTPPPLSLEQRFEVNVAAKAQSLLQANKDRLNTEQTQYAQDNDPKSDRWQHLWQAAEKRRAYETQEHQMVDERMRLIEESNGLGTALDPLYDKPADQTRKQERSADLAARQSFLTRQIQQARQMQVSLTYAYPALSAIRGETGDNPQDIQKVQERLPGEFDGIRGNIDRLSRELTQDPSTALLFDSVVATQLQDKSLTPQQQQQLTDWLKSERAGKEQAQQLGGLVSGGLFMASFVPQLKGISLGLRLLGIGGGAAVVASELPDLIWLDAAAQAGRGGEGQLTSQSPEQARFNLVMGYANLGLAGLDVGMEVGAVQRLARIPGVVSAVGALTREQGRVLMMSLGRLKSDVSDAVVQKMAQAVKGADELTAMTIVNADGTLTQSRPLGQMADNMQATVAARSSGKAKKPPKAFDEYANALTVKPFIGSKVDPNNLPEGYLYGKMPLENGKFREVIYLPESNSDMVPLKLDAKGFIQKAPEGKYRIVNKTAYDKNVVTDPDKRGKLLGGDSEVHHLYADNLLRGTPFGQRALKLGAVNPDTGPNLIELASSLENLEKARKAHPNVQFSDFVHNTQHPEFDKLMQDVVNKEITALRQEKGLGNLENEEFIPQMTKEDVQNVWDGALEKMKAGLMGEDRALYQRIKERTRPGKDSLAQSESSESIKVA